MLALIPTAGAFVGTAWGVSHPAEVVRHGLVVAQLSTGRVLLAAFIGGIGGFLLLLGAVFAVTFVRYRLLGVGDDVWEATYEGSADGVMCFELRCKGAFAVSYSELGATECLIRTPSGSVLTATLWPRGNPEGVVGRIQAEPETGVYEARWYAARGERRLHEIARSKTAVAS
jgi:hypothetical protein